MLTWNKSGTLHCETKLLLFYYIRRRHFYQKINANLQLQNQPNSRSLKGRFCGTHRQSATYSTELAIQYYSHIMVARRAQLDGHKCLSTKGLDITFRVATAKRQKQNYDLALIICHLSKSQPSCAVSQPVNTIAQYLQLWRFKLHYEKTFPKLVLLGFN